MKMVKKILLGLTAAAAVLTIVGCKTSDDTEHAITGSNNDYSVDYTNGGSDAYRAYESTAMKHAGALVKVTFENPEAGNFSKMGVIFDLHDNEADNSAKDFYIIGLASTTTDNYYISKFTNVTQLQAVNFGTELESNRAVETVIWDTSKSNGIGTITRPSPAEDGSVSYYVYYKAFANDGHSTNQTDSTKGYYEVAVYNFTDAQAEAAKALMKTDAANAAALGTPIRAAQIIPNAFDLGTNNAVVQNQIAVYAKIDAGKTLKGKWKFLDMYKEAEEIEE